MRLRSLSRTQQITKSLSSLTLRCLAGVRCSQPQIWARTGVGPTKSWLVEPSLSLVVRDKEIALANRRSRPTKAGKNGGVGKRMRHMHVFDPRVLTSISILSTSTTLNRAEIAVPRRNYHGDIRAHGQTQPSSQGTPELSAGVFVVIRTLICDNRYLFRTTEEELESEHQD